MYQFADEMKSQKERDKTRNLLSTYSCPAVCVDTDCLYHVNRWECKLNKRMENCIYFSGVPDSKLVSTYNAWEVS